MAVNQRVTDAEIISFIQEFWQEHDYGPTFREVGEGVGLSSTNTVQRRLLQLREHNRVDYIDGHPRTLRVPSVLDGFMSVGVVRQVMSVDNLPTNDLLVMVREPITELPDTIGVEVYGVGKVKKGKYVQEVTCKPVKVKQYFTGCSNCGAVWDHFYMQQKYRDSKGPHSCPDCGATNIRWNT